jgi:hypothetical protein
MCYAAVWKVLEAMIKDLRKKGANTSSEAAKVYSLENPY